MNGHTEKRPVMQLVTNRAPLNRAIYKASQAIGLTPPPPAETPEADTPGEEMAEADKARLERRTGRESRTTCPAKRS